MTAREKLFERIKELEELTDLECNCDTEEPWEFCKGCLAAKELNKVYFIVNKAYLDIIIGGKGK